MSSQPRGKPPSESAVEMTEMVMPVHTNAVGTVFGGTVMSWVDIAAATCALRHCGCQVVTASVDAMHFLEPIKLGWVASVKAVMNFTARTSCEVGVDVDAENPITGEKFHTATAYLTFVAIGSDGKPRVIPPVLPETPEEQERYQAAAQRRIARLALKESIISARRAAESVE